MPALKLTIPGRYWDSQLHRGRLYLFDREGTIQTLDWDKLIERLPVKDAFRLALDWAFRRSDFLYRLAATGIFRDEEIRTILNRRFSILSDMDLVVEEEQFSDVSIGQQDNTFPFPHADSVIHYPRLYVSSQSGIFAATCNRRTKSPVSTHVDQLWDGPVLTVGAWYRSLALAAGEEGLWEYALGENYPSATKFKENPHRLSKEHCSDCQWAFYSIYGSSLNGPGILASYVNERDGTDREGRQSPRHRKFDRLVSEQEIFSGFADSATHYSWAAQDKICQAANGTMRVAKYQPWNREMPVQPHGFLPLENNGEAVVSAKVALFGTVVEFDSGLIVLTSHGYSHRFAGEPVSWRVFPHSRHYENHLHVIYDDRLEVHSFNHDHLVDQRKKISGTASFISNSRQANDASLVSY